MVQLLMLMSGLRKIAMNRDYNTGVATDIQFFVGEEVEKTPAFGMKT